MKAKTLTEFKDGDINVVWVRNGRGTHVITYGKQVSNFPPTHSLEACHEFGECVRHSLERAGLLDR